MTAIGHSIRHQTLDIEVDCEAAAMALQPSLQDFNRRRLLPLIERVLDDLDEPGMHIRISSLELDLGSMAIEHWQDDAEQRLEVELRRGLGNAIRQAHVEPTSEVFRRPLGQSRLRLAEHYLIYGTVPFWAAAERSSFNFETLFRSLIEEDPAGLVALILRRGRRASVLERMAAQLTESSLEQLIALLEPVHATLIITYIQNLREIHRARPLLTLSEGQFSRIVWVLAQGYLVQEPGSQFNRRSFVKTMLEGMARGRGLDYLEILDTLRQGLARLAARFPLSSSLTTVIQDLVRDARRVSGEDPEQDLASLERYLQSDAAGPEDPREFQRLGQRLARQLPRQTRSILLHHARQRSWLAESAIDHLLGLFSLEDLVVILAPSQRSQVLELIRQLRNLSSARRPSEAVLRQATIEHLLQGKGPRTVDGLLRASAARSGNSARAWVDDFARSDPTPASEQLIRELRRESAGAQQMQAIFARYDRLDVLSFFLRHGLLPWDAALQNPKLTRAALAATLPDLPLPLLRRLLPSTTEARINAIYRALETMVEERQQEWIRGLLPASAQETGSPMWQAISSFGERAADRRMFHARLIHSLLAGHGLDFEAMIGLETPGLDAAESEGDGSVELWAARLVRLLRQPASASATHDEISNLVERLASSPGGDLWVLEGLAASADLRDRLLDSLTPAGLAQVIDLICPRGVPSFQLLSDVCAALPVSQRPGIGRIRRAIFAEAMHLGRHRSPTRASFTRILAALGASREAFEVMLDSHLESDSRAGLGQPEALAELRQALTMGSAEEATTTTAPQPATGERQQLRSVVFSFLLGEPSAAERSPGPDAGTAGVGLPRLSEDGLRHATRKLLDESPEEVYSFVRQHAADRHKRERWAKILPESALVRLSFLLEPRKHRELLDAAETLASAWLTVLPSGSPALTQRSSFWSFLLGFLCRGTVAQRSVGRLTAAWFEDCLSRYLATSPATPDLAGLGARLLDQAEALARRAGLSYLLAVLHRDRRQLLAAWGEPAAGQQTADTGAADTRGGGVSEKPREERPETRRRPTHKAEPMREEPEDPVYISNAGLVLVGPFLPKLFDMLELLCDAEDGGSKIAPDKASRAVHLLQYLVTERTDTCEPELFLNKLICGLPSDIVIDQAIEPAAHELEKCDQLLSSMIANWPSLSNTSVAGLREFFLQREGRLHPSPEGWQLRVQRKTVDVLVDQVPWNVSVLYHRWMPGAIHVTW